MRLFFLTTTITTPFSKRREPGSVSRSTGTLESLCRQARASYCGSSKLQSWVNALTMKVKCRLCAWLCVHSLQPPSLLSVGQPEPGFCSITGTVTSGFLLFAFLFLSALFSPFPQIPFGCLFMQACSVLVESEYAYAQEINAVRWGPTG